MEFKIGNTPVGGDAPCFIVAELSCNHRGNLQTARDMIEAAALAGVNAVKLQTDNPSGGITIDCDNKHFQIVNSPWKGKTLYQLYRETYTPWSWLPALKKLAQECMVELFSTPSCLDGLEYLEGWDMPAYKISSYEITDFPLIEATIQIGKPIIMSDGCMVDSDARNELWDIIKNYPTRALLHCNSQYPAHAKGFSLSYIKNFAQYNWVPGLSDHSMGNEITFAAVALGAKIIERHFTLDRQLGGPDAGFSLEPHEFASMVRGIRNIEIAAEPKELQHSQEWCKSIFVVRDIIGGEILTKDNLGIIRPGAGMHPKHWREVLGKKAARPLKRGEPLKATDYT